MADGVWDLTRSLAFPTTTPKTIQALGTRKSIIIEPSRSALVMIDMQSEPIYFYALGFYHQWLASCKRILDGYDINIMRA